MTIISAETSLIGVIGNPVKHSLSPLIHNAALEAMNLNWCYLAIPCETKNLDQVIRGLGSINCKGLNITIPHKKEALNLCNDVSSIGKQIGAINTLIPDKKGGWNGDNTDAEGFIAPLKNKNWKRKKAIILGCGGSARAVLISLKLLNFQEIIIVGRKLKKLNIFLNDMQSSVNDSRNLQTCITCILEDDNELIEHIQNSDLVVNTTPIGMTGGQSEMNSLTPMPLGQRIWNNLQTSITFYDLIYTPRPTPWLLNAAENGHETIDGLQMLINQGAASLKLWTGREDIPIEIMREAAEKHLSN